MNYFKDNLEYLVDIKSKSDQLESRDVRQMERWVNDFINSYYANPSVDELWDIASFFEISIDDLVKKNLEELSAFRKKDIKLLALDIDGVLTDGGLYYSEKGDEQKKFNVKDGLGMKALLEKGVEIGLISAGHAEPIAKARAERLGIKKVYVGTEEKLKVLENWCKEMKINVKNVAYIGDDLTDLSAVKKAEISACPADAVPKIRESCHITLSAKGGEGCVREFIDDYLI
jgi:3-deoxy-D-manno-octulosonate 8-phosphate phosphatase (KDO 8-P phosphatase)